MKAGLLTQVHQAEQEAAKRLEAAEGEARDLKAQARRDAEKIVADGRAAADDAYRATLDEARAAADKEAAKILKQGDKDADKLRDRFAAGIDGVTDRALKLFEESL